MLRRFLRNAGVDNGITEVATGHTSDRMSGRIEAVARGSGRRAWSVEQKLAMLRDAFGPGGSVRAGSRQGPTPDWRATLTAKVTMAGMGV